MNRQFYPRAQGAVQRLTLTGKKQEPFSDRQVQLCRGIDAEMGRLLREIDSAVSDIASISDEMRGRIERLGNRDTVAAMQLAAEIAGLAGGIYAIYKVATRARGILASLTAYDAANGFETIKDLISIIDNISPKLDDIREGIDISGPRRQLRDARNRINFANRKLRELKSGYDRNQCDLVFDTFSR